jgi:3'-phosphoadenosine 5'-phosphosulfate sulfotransferase (PAPS reductase)/FAD synthetase
MPTAAEIGSLKLLSEAAAKHGGKCLVSFSGGKDSCAVLDLACRSFKSVTCFFLYFIPGLEVCERQLQFARDRWRVEILYYPHWLLFDCLRHGRYCPPNPAYDSLSQITLTKFYEVIRRDTGIRCLLHGAKRADGIWRRRTLRIRHEADPDCYYPCEWWKKKDVLLYLQSRNIPLPDSAGGDVGGIDLSDKCLLWLYDKHPADFKKLLAIFPFAQAVVARREFYGIGRK